MFHKGLQGKIKAIFYPNSFPRINERKPSFNETQLNHSRFNINPVYQLPLT